MLIIEILREKLKEYTEMYGAEAGFDLLVMEVEAELCEIYISINIKQNIIDINHRS